METKETKLEYTLKGGVKIEILFHYEDGRLYKVAKKSCGCSYFEYFGGFGCGCDYYLASTNEDCDVHKIDLKLDDIMKLWKDNCWEDVEHHYIIPNYPDLYFDHY